MFCNEKIIAAYEGWREYHDIENADAFFDCYHDLAFHVTAGYRIVLETMHFFISLAANGVTISNKDGSVEEFREEGEWLVPFIHTDLCEEGEDPWVDYESTLFVGERLVEVENEDGIFLLNFDHFRLKVVPHESGDDMPSFQRMNDWSYLHVYGTERLIRRKCDCGGSGELLLDFVADYVVRCKKCKKSTWAEMNAIQAIEAWEAGEIYCDLSEITIQ